MSDRRVTASQAKNASVEKGRRPAAQPKGASAFSAHTTGSRPDGELVNRVVRSAGMPLDETSRAFFEQRFGHDFGRVRVHTDGPAAESAESLLADAYTAGDHIVFGTGRYAPADSKGKALLTHELSHVAQQSSPRSFSGSFRVSRPDSAAEQAAEANVQRLALGLPAARRTVAEPGVIHRAIKEDLLDAIAGWGTDEEAIYARLRIAGKEEKQAVLGDPVLMQDLQDDLSRDEWGTVLGLLGASTESRVHAASEGWGTDEEGIFEALRATPALELQRQMKGSTLLVELRDELSDDELGQAQSIITKAFLNEGAINYPDTYHALLLFPDTVNEASDHFEALGHDVAKDIIAYLARGHEMPDSVETDTDTQINHDKKLARVQAAFEARWNISSQAKAGTSGKAPAWTVDMIRRLHAALRQVPEGHVVRADQNVPGVQKGELSGFRLIEGSSGFWSNPFIEVGEERSDVAGLTRHEVGHAMDDYLGSATETFKKNSTNGWDWSDTSVMWETHMADPWKRKNGKEVPLADQLQINTLLDAYVKSNGSEGLRKGTAQNHPIRTYWDDDVPMIEAAKDLAGKKDKVYQHLGSVRKFGACYFSWSTYYKEFYVYNLVVQDKRVTDYSLFGHPEFFAEMYEAYYEEGSGVKRGDKLKGVANWKQFFDTVVHPAK